MDKTKKVENIQDVSLIFLLYNGKRYVKDKIAVLRNELSCFRHYEIIIIDDGSNDGPDKILDELKSDDRIKVIQKKNHTGIADSMNTAVKHALYETIVFCDQRQQLSENSLRKLIDPLEYAEVGAVSGCLSPVDTRKGDSLVRRHENMIKYLESKSGMLMGVYGPLYAIRKSCYPVLPDEIILDDLYLSLKILQKKCVILAKECTMTDESFSTLYNYSRAKRYLAGLIQLLAQKNLIRPLKTKQRIMLMWHKYLRLMIPLLFSVCYMLAGINVAHGPLYVVVFTAISVLCIASFLQGLFFYPSRIINVFRINMLYAMAMFELFIKAVLSILEINDHGVKANLRMTGEKTNPGSNIDSTLKTNFYDT